MVPIGEQRKVGGGDGEDEKPVPIGERVTPLPPNYGIFRLVADGARHGKSVTAVLMRLCF